MHSYLSLRRFRTLAFIISALFLWGCVGEGDGPQRIAGTPPAALTGVLVDAPVSGASYFENSGLSGLTNDAGEFQYRPFGLVAFSIGDIFLGTTQGAPYLTVVELTNSVDPTSPAATNMLVFLQSIDSDGDPTNGITISAATRTAAAGRSLDFFAADFDTQVAAIVAAIAPGNSVISSSDALFNFYQTYAELGGTDTFDFGFPGFPPVGGGLTYERIFADEFNGDSLSAANWNIETGYGPDNNGWGNNEWQLYTDSADNLRVEDGNLVISAQCPTPPCGVRDGTVTSARINSLDKVEFRYGKIIARIKPPVGPGTWPAFWSMGANFPEIGWPRSGEIDFMEMFAGVSDSRTTHSTIHWCDENFAPPLPALCFPEANGKRAFTQSRTFAESLGDDFHIWETDWTPGRITVSMDGVQYFDAFIDPATQEEFLRDFFLIFNVAMGGTAGSNDQPPNGTETFPQTMLVDYVRVYQQVGDGPAGDVLVDFEDAPDSYVFGPDGGFAGGASSVIPNPDPTGINTTAQVAQMLKFFVPPPETFGGSTLSLFSNLNFAQGEVFKMKVWATRPVPVLFKLEDATSGLPENGLERFVDHTGSGMWEELCFDFSGATANFTSNSITFIFDIDNSGDAENNPNDWTFYYDEIEQTDSCDSVEPPPPPPPLISSFSNGSFEGGDLAGWQSNGANTVGAPGVGAFVGTLAANLTAPGGMGVADLSQTFAAAPGDEINISVRVLTEAALPAGDTFGLAKIVFQDANGNDLEPASASIGTLITGEFAGIESTPILNDASPVNTWIFSEAQGVAPAGTAQVVFLLLNIDFAGGENPMWFDDAQISLVTDEPPPPPPPPMELAISNGGFETGDLTDWVGGGTVGAPGVGARTGDFAAELPGGGVGEIRQTFDAIPGDEVNLSVWMLTEGALPTGATFGLGKIVFKDAAGNDLAPASASIGTLQSGDNPGIETTPFLNDASTPNTWIFSEAQGVAPAGTTQVAFLLLNIDFAGGVNNMWFDDAQASLVGDEPPPPPPMELALSNGGFETGDLTDWVGGGTVGAPGVGARTGDFAAELPGGGVGEIRQTFDAIPGDEVNLSVWMLTEAALPTGATFGLGKIVFKDAAGNDLAPASASIGTLQSGDNPGIETTPFLNDASTPNTWIFSEAQGVAPAGTTQVAFLLLNIDFAGGVNNMWFDDAAASLVEGDGGVGEACSPCTIDFETPGFGGGFDWSVFENADNPPLEIVANPDMTGNTSATVAKFTARVGGEFFAGVQTFHPGVNNDPGVADIGPFTFDSTNSVVKVWVWKPVISEVRMQFVNTTDGAQEPLSATNTLVNQWEELTFDFTSFIGTTGFVDTDRLVIFPDWNQAGRTSENIIYFDNFTFGTNESPPPPPPMELALSNGGFETGDLTDWVGGGTVGAPGVGARTGDFAAELPGGGVGEIRQTFDAIPGDEVNLSVWMLTEGALPTGATFGLGKIVFKDAAGNDLAPASASIGTLQSGDNPGIETTPFLNDASTPNTWIFSEAQGVAPAGTTQVAFLLLNIDFAGGVNNMWFDDAQASLVGDEPPPPPPMELALSNGGFETGDLTDWVGGGTVGAPGVGARTGDFAAELPGGGVGEIRQTFDAIPGDEVNLSVWMLTEGALPTGATFGLGKIVFKDAAGNDLAPASASIGTLQSGDNPGIETTPFLNDASTPNTWIFSEAQGVAPAGTTQVAFLLLNIDFAGGVNNMWFDDAQASLVGDEPPPPPPMELALSNGGFETGDLTDWVGGGTVGAPGVGARTGDFAAELPGGGVGEIRQTFDAIPGDEVNLSVWMLTEGALPTGATFGLGKIVFKDAAGNDLAPASASIGTLQSGDNPGIETTPFLNDASTPNTWIFSEAQGVAPAGTTQVAFLLLNIDFAGGVNNMWFDDAQASLVGDEPPPPPPMELALSNGGFETGDLTDWVGGGTVGAPGVGARTGDFAAELPGGGVGEIRQTFDAIPGDEVNLSVWMLTEAALPTGATFGLGKIVFKDAAGNDLAPASASIGTLQSGDNPGIETTPFLNDASTPNTWIFSEAQGVAPAGTTQVVFLLLNIDFAGGVNNMWFDDAQASLVTAGEPPPPPPMALALSNGGFETGDLTDWVGGGTVGAPGVGAQEGSFAAQLTTTGGAGVAEIRQTFDAAPGDEVNFSVYMLTEAALPTGATFGLGKIIFQDADGNDLVPESASIGVLNTDNPGVDSAPTLNDTSPVNTWVFTEAQGVAPAGTTQVAFLLLNVDFAGGENPMWFDGAQASIVDACGGDVGGELTTNGDFEGSPGTLDCWDIFPGGGTITADSTENNTIGGMWSAHAVAGPGNNPVLKQSFLAPGVVQPGDTILISFDMKGSAVAGGIVFPELIDERSDMGATGQLLDTIVAPTPGWTTYFYSPMAGPDVAGGITFQIAVVCGGDPACSNNVFIDNVSVQISGGG